MRNLLIIGARGYGREVYNLFLECKSHLNDVECKGFLDDNTCALDGFSGYPPIIDSVERYLPQENDVFICALGDPKWIRHYTDIIEQKGGKFMSLISPDANISKNVKIGDGTIISRWASISCDITIGRHSSIGVFCDLGHGTVIGDCCHIGSFAFTGGGTIVGDGVTFHPRVSVLPHKKIGDQAIIGAGSVVIRSVKADTTVFGVPAKKL
ncbi:MAG: acetyltransferase [Pseudoflavonifractor sp.]|nr:acetyltransferase [Pseudoflavonifractor sp.]